jgi:23S rRNA A2030 N6-methylase RlmJ
MAKTSTSSKKLVELKTKQNSADVNAFVSAVVDEQKRNDSLTLLKMMKAITKQEPMMWGDSIVGFGKYIYKSPATGRTGEWFIVGFSPRKANLTVYIIAGFTQYSELMKKLGKYKTGSSCLYMNRLDDVDIKVLKELITTSYKYMKEKYK